MGEMTDFYIDQMMDAYGDSPYGGGYGEPNVECKNCGKAGLHWEEDDGRWVLCNPNGRTHVCDPDRLKRAVIDDFEVLG